MHPSLNSPIFPSLEPVLFKSMLCLVLCNQRGSSLPLSFLNRKLVYKQKERKLPSSHSPSRKQLILSLSFSHGQYTAAKDEETFSLCCIFFGLWTENNKSLAQTLCFSLTLDVFLGQRWNPWPRALNPLQNSLKVSLFLCLCHGL
jgi:hypothetical protein